MKKVLVVVIISFLFSSCEENNYYTEEISSIEKRLETITFSNLLQKEEMRRRNFNFSLEYTDNSVPGGSVNLLVIDQYGDVIYQEEKILLENSGLIQTGTLSGLEEATYSIAIENIVDEMYYYNSPGKLFYKQSIEAKYGEFDFQMDLYDAASVIQSSENSFLEYSGIRVDGGNLTLTKSRVYVKVTEGSINLWKLIHNVYSNKNSRYGFQVGWYSGRYENDWNNSGNEFSYIEDSVNEELSEDKILALNYRINSYGIPSDVKIEYYMEYFFIDETGESHSVSSEKRPLLIKKSENITEFEVDEDDVYRDKDNAQEFLEYSFETQFEKVKKEEISFNLRSDDAEVNTLFSNISLYNEETSEIQIIGLTESSWEHEADGSYTLIIPFNNEIINAHDYAEYKIFLKLSEKAKENEMDVYIEGTFRMKTSSETQGEKIFSQHINFDIED